jgi:hypothetical protein
MLILRLSRITRKKSWHPLLLSNQQRVWEVEKKAVSVGSGPSLRALLPRDH